MSTDQKTVTPVVKLPPGAEQYLRANRQVSRGLHGLDGAHRRGALPIPSDEAARCINYGILQFAGEETVTRPNGSSEPRNTWTVSPAARRLLDDYGTGEGPWPDCEHTGIRNLGDDQFGCGDSDCPEVYSRATAEGVQL